MNLSMAPGAAVLPQPTLTAKHSSIGIGLALAIAMLGSVLLMPVAVRYAERDAEYLLASAAIGVVFELGLAAIVYRMTVARGLSVAVLGLTRKGWRLSAVVLGLAASYASLYLYLLVVSFFDVTALEPSKQLPTEAFDYRGVVVLLGISVVVLAPVCEELFFRVLLFRGFSHTLGVVPGTIVSGFLFSLAHLNLGAVIPFTLIGIAFAVAYHRTGSLLTPITMHFAFNTFSFSLLVLLPEARG